MKDKLKTFCTGAFWIMVALSASAILYAVAVVLAAFIAKFTVLVWNWIW